MMSDADRVLAVVVIVLLEAAARAWADGDECAAVRLTSGAWRIVGTDTFVDADQ